jgi:hypothetical protein
VGVSKSDLVWFDMTFRATLSTMSKTARSLWPAAWNVSTCGAEGRLRVSTTARVEVRRASSLASGRGISSRSASITAGSILSVLAIAVCGGTQQSRAWRTFKVCQTTVLSVGSNAVTSMASRWSV